MHAFLVRRAPVHGVTYYIDGFDLLRLLQKVVNERKRNLRQFGEGDGTEAKPWRLKTAENWMGRAVNLPRNQDNFLIVGGRLIRRGRDQYISDEGPAWRAGHEGALPTIDAGYGLTGATKGPAPASLKAFKGVAPTYREAAQQIADPNKILPDATERRKSAGLALAESWSSSAKQPVLVDAMRALLKAEKMALFVDDKVNKEYSRMQTALPVLVVAMFLAETARNPRAFPVNLMLLDLAQRGVYTMDRILWHPHALEVDKAKEASPTWNGLLPIPGGETGPTSKTVRQVVPLENRGQLHLVGGIMPASPTGGGELSKTEALPGKATGAKPKFAPDYIHAKEASVLLRWLSLSTYGGWQPTVEPPGGSAVLLPYHSVVFSADRPLGVKVDGSAPLNRELAGFEASIRSRISELKAIP